MSDKEQVRAPLHPGEQPVMRFAADLDALVEPAGSVGVAVSGGPDSLALLLLAAAARPGLVEAATVDHGLRPESRREAEGVAALCSRIGVHHAILRLDGQPPPSNLQAWARQARYDLLGQWGKERRLDAVATGHQLDDQAETLLMRAARGSGISGLAGIKARRLLVTASGTSIPLVRPLLHWRRDELLRIVRTAGLQAVEDPSNKDERFDRTRARALLGETDWLDPGRLAAAADHASDAEEALEWCVQREFDARSTSPDAATMTLEPAGLPRELRRRLLVKAIAMLAGQAPPGPQIMTALAALDRGGTTTLAGLKLEGNGARWRLSPAPPRRQS